MDEPDPDLFRRARDGDPEAFGHLRTVALLEMEELNSPEIARILDRPESTIRTWRGQVRVRLHSILCEDSRQGGHRSTDADPRHD